MEGALYLTAEKRKIGETILHDEGTCKRVKVELQNSPQSSFEDAEHFITLLHLSDDVLLNIFGYCTPTDIRALSFCNRRLHILCSDRSLWRRVDLRDRRMGAKALSIYVRSLPRHTTQALCVRGLVGRPNTQNKSKRTNKNDENVNTSESQTVTNQDKKCNTFRDKNAMPSTSKLNDDTPSTTGEQNYENSDSVTGGDGEVRENKYDVVKESGNSSPKPFSPSYDTNASTSSPSSSNNKTAKDSKEDTQRSQSCGKQNEGEEDWTVTKELMTSIKKKCPDLKELRLEFCYIDCNSIQSSSFPSTLETLSLRASVCRNIPLSRAYLFRLHEHCPKLTDIDLSRCGWLASHSLLVLSKVPTLKRLSLKHCWGLGECVAYASLSARYGFKSLEVLDIRGTPMGDSEITAFSLIGPLKELLLQGSGVVEDSGITGMVGSYASNSPTLRSRQDVGEPLAWEEQDPSHCGEEWSWSSDSEEDGESEQHDEGAGGGDQNLNDPANPVQPQLAEEGVDPFEAVGRVHVIYVDVRRAPHNNMLRVRYAPVQQPVAPEQQEQHNDQEEVPQPGIEVQINNHGEGNRDAGNYPDVVIHREGENHINLRVQYANDDGEVNRLHRVEMPPAPENNERRAGDRRDPQVERPEINRLHRVERPPAPENNERRAGDRQDPQVGRPEINQVERPPAAENNQRRAGDRQDPQVERPEINRVERPPAPENNQRAGDRQDPQVERPEVNRLHRVEMPPAPENNERRAGDRQEPQVERPEVNRLHRVEIPPAPENNERRAGDRQDPQGERPDHRMEEIYRLIRIHEGHMREMHRRHRHLHPEPALQPNNVRNRDVRQGNQENQGNGRENHNHAVNNDNPPPVNIENEAVFEEEVFDQAANLNELRHLQPPRLLARPGEFLRRGPAFVLYPNEQQANRIIQHQHQAPVIHRREVIPHLLYDFKHTMRQLENFVAKFRTTEEYDGYVRRIHFFRRMLQQIYNNEPVFNTIRTIPEKPVADQRDIVRIRRLIESTCHHLERLIARAIQYPPDEIPFRINYNYVENPEYVAENREDENDARMRPETVEFYIQRYFGVPPAEEVHVDMRHGENERQQVNAPQLNEPVVRIFDRNVAAAEEIVDIVNNIHNVLQERGEEERIENILNVMRAGNNPAMADNNANNQQENVNARPAYNPEDVARMVNIRNINIEIREHNVQVPILPVGEVNQNIAAHRHIDEHIERMVHDEIRAMQQEHQFRRNRNDPRAPDERIRLEGPFVIRGDVMEEGGRRRRRVVHIPFQLNIRGAGEVNDVNHVGTSNLVTDASLLRFGVCKNIVHIGGDAQFQQQSATRGGQLTTLVCRGYPRVTDRALSHLAAASPKLTRLDLSHTGVTRVGALAFRAARQDCELIVEHLQDNGDD